jgi:mersacidin/lichenicidin family type 2 lantibiotic
MSKVDIIRAWKDEEYANGLTDVQRAMLPQNPAGIIELSDQDLDQAAGGTTLIPIITLDNFCISLMYSCITLGCTITIGITELEA